MGREEERQRLLDQRQLCLAVKRRRVFGPGHDRCVRLAVAGSLYCRLHGGLSVHPKA